MSGDDNIRDVHDEDGHDFDEDFIVGKDAAPDSNQPEDQDAVADDQPGSSQAADEEDGDQDEEPRLDDEESLVLEGDSQPAILGSGDEDGYLLEDDFEPDPPPRAKTLEDIFSAQEEKLKTTSSDPEEEVLFDVVAMSSSNEFDVGDQHQFKETGGLGWEGEDVDPESLGIRKPKPVDDPTSLGDPQELLDADAAAMEIEQDFGLELVEFDSDLDRPAVTPLSQITGGADESAMDESAMDESAMGEFAMGEFAMDEFAMEESAMDESTADEFAADELVADDFAADDFAAEDELAAGDFAADDELAAGDFAGEDELAADDFAGEDEFAVDDSAAEDEFAVDDSSTEELAEIEFGDEFADEFAVDESYDLNAETAGVAAEVDDDGDPLWVLDETDEPSGSELEPALVVGSRDDADPGEGWEPLDESASQHEGGAPAPYPVYAGGDADAQDEEPEAAEQQHDYAEYKARFGHRREAAEAPGPEGYETADVVGPLPQRRGRGLLAAAATILILGLAGAAYVKPQAFLDLFGIRQEAVEVVNISRPGLDVDQKEPKPPVVKQPVAEPPVVKQPIVEPPVVKQPVVEPRVVEGPTKPPAVKDPEVEPVVRPEPLAPLVPPAPEAPATGVTAVPLKDADRIPFGADGEGGYMKGIGRDGLPSSNAPEAIRRDLDLVLGSKALAQLMNNNIFLGRVKALDSTYVTLRLERGEVTLPLVDIRILTHLAQDEYRSLQNLGKDGFVYLRNDNRLAGVIVAQRDDAVVLQVKANRVVIPKSEIEHVQETETKRDVLFSEEDTLEKDDWVRRMVEEELGKRRRKGSQPPK